MIASRILVQAEAELAAVVTAAGQEVPGVSGAASMTWRCDVMARAGTRDAGELARPGGFPRPSPAPGRGR